MNKARIQSDALSGFLVFLLALPLSLGIAKASEFPAIMGLFTAMVGGILVSFFAGSQLTIKGPAAGLIVIVAGAVTELGQGDNALGWHYALGAIAVAGVIQILFGLIKMGSLADFFPLSAIHGMLAAIGIIIMSKQIHLTMGGAPLNEHGKSILEPLELLAAIPHSIANLNPSVLLIGIISLIIVFAWPKVKHPILSKIPAPVLVLAVSIPLAKLVHLDQKFLVHFDKNFFDTIAWNISFKGLSLTGTFIKFVIMFALVGSLESLLTVKAIDMMDPEKRKSNANKDLIAVGIGNIVASILGGLPMISEVARSSANVNNGAKTRWANFFHGLFILIFLLFDLQFSDLIPNAALAALLIGVGYKLANPKEFGHMAKIGPEQLFIFSLTIVVTLMTDLLVGIGAGILAKLVTQYILGVPVNAAFKAHVQENDGRLQVFGAAVFSNWLGIQKVLSKHKPNENLVLDFHKCNVVDFTVMDNLHHLHKEFQNAGGSIQIEGLEEMEYTSKNKHPQGVRKRGKEQRFDKQGNPIQK